jgi:L-2-hydroxycarboxylate dehydrogenase (NAD+)
VRGNCGFGFVPAHTAKASFPVYPRLRNIVISENSKASTSQAPLVIAKLVEFIARALAAVGVPQEDAAQVAQLMAEADLRGVFRLMHYVKQIESGAVNPWPKIRVASSQAETALLDGENGQGHLAMNRPAELAIEKARACGVAWVGTPRSNHAGPAEIYPRMVAARDMIGMYFCEGSANLLPPWAGTEVLLSTNPIAIDVSGSRHPSITLDMATTNTAFARNPNTRYVASGGSSRNTPSVPQTLMV